MLLIPICLVNSVNEKTEVDGIITAKVSNLTGYDLWYPDGSFEWTNELQGDYLCNNWWYSEPFKNTVHYFHWKGFLLAVGISAILTFIFTASFPMLILITKQNKFITTLVKKNRCGY